MTATEATTIIDAITEDDVDWEYRVVEVGYGQTYEIEVWDDGELLGVL